MRYPLAPFNPFKTFQWKTWYPPTPFNTFYTNEWAAQHFQHYQHYLTILGRPWRHAIIRAHCSPLPHRRSINSSCHFGSVSHSPARSHTPSHLELECVLEWGVRANDNRAAEGKWRKERWRRGARKQPRLALYSFGMFSDIVRIDNMWLWLCWSFTLSCTVNDSSVSCGIPDALV